MLRVLLTGFVLLLPLLGSGRTPAEEALEHNDFELAARLAAAELKSGGGNSRAHVAAARARIGQNDAPGALTELEAALKIDPRNSDALYYMNKLTAVLAHQELTRLYKIAPDSGRVHQLMAESLHAQDDTAGEEREYRAALEKMPDSAVILNALGDIARYHSRYEEGVALYERAEKADPGNFDALYGLGACQLFLEKYPLAVEFLERALRRDPASVAARLALGDALLREQEYDRAVKVLAVLTQTEPSAKQGWALYGKALRQSGRKAEADAAFARYRDLVRAGEGSQQ